MPESVTYELLMDGFHEASKILNEKHSTLAADPVLAGLAKLVGRDPASGDVKLAVLQVLDSQEFSAAAEVIQYFAQMFRWSWLEAEVGNRYLESVTNGDRRKTRHYERMLEAFAEDWEDRDLFPSLNVRER
ncbi:hypothetical protein [Streptomyces sp. ISL-100]|uniref:hypothetical protein n=1 Tax=Streptomyces sp. ISL-100 TaxID=2819173 RepID=UPI001BE71DF9|nr:hypothetical protein [Streptomyces sp. ISL-100]MBT2401224.1 hypothetical protein [Streptomyces sp. ISL-100]